MLKRERGGFTLIELLTVVVMISLLAGMLFAVLQQAKQMSRKRRCVAEMRELTRAWNAFYYQYGVFPSVTEMDKDAIVHLQGNGAINTKKIKFMDFSESSATEGFKDPWGNLYRVNLTTKEPTNAVWTYTARVFFANKTAYEKE